MTAGVTVIGTATANGTAETVIVSMNATASRFVSAKCSVSGTETEAGTTIVSESASASMTTAPMPLGLRSTASHLTIRHYLCAIEHRTLMMTATSLVLKMVCSSVSNTSLCAWVMFIRSLQPGCLAEAQ